MKELPNKNALGLSLALLNQSNSGRALHARRPSTTLHGESQKRWSDMQENIKREILTEKEFIQVNGKLRDKMLVAKGTAREELETAARNNENTLKSFAVSSGISFQTNESGTRLSMAVWIM